MMLIDDVSVLTRLLRGQPTVGSHAENLQAFYAPQAARYDAFRERLLHGRETLIDLLDVWPGDRVVELGGGTGRNLDHFGERLPRLESYDLIDLCPALLDVARHRAIRYVSDSATDQSMHSDAADNSGRHCPYPERGGDNIRIVEADATSWRPKQPVDVVLFSYSLTMIPDWRAALANAHAMLRPGGKIAIVDFHLPLSASGLANRFWQRWFAHDGVRLSQDHLPTLVTLFDPLVQIERQAPVPYLSTLLPGLRVPYYLFIGSKR